MKAKVDGFNDLYGFYLPSGYNRTTHAPCPPTGCKLKVKLHAGSGCPIPQGPLEVWDDREIVGGSLFPSTPGPTTKNKLMDTIFLNLCSRGPGHSYTLMAEAGVLEAIADAESRWAIDAAQVTIWGASMGGTGAYRMATLYPNLFAGAGAFTGGSNYQLPGNSYYPRDTRLPVNAQWDAGPLVQNLTYTSFELWDNSSYSPAAYPKLVPTVSSGAIIGFKFISGGTGWLASTAVTVIPSSGSRFAGTTLVSDGAITGVAVMDGGSGYPSVIPPTAVKVALPVYYPAHTPTQSCVDANSYVPPAGSRYDISVNDSYYPEACRFTLALDDLSTKFNGKNNRGTHIGLYPHDFQLETDACKNLPCSHGHVNDPWNIGGHTFLAGSIASPKYPAIVNYLTANEQYDGAYWIHGMTRKRVTNNTATPDTGSILVSVSRSTITVTTTNLSRFSLDLTTANTLFKGIGQVTVIADGTTLAGIPTGAVTFFDKPASTWVIDSAAPPFTKHKVPRAPLPTCSPAHRSCWFMARWAETTSLPGRCWQGSSS